MSVGFERFLRTIEADTRALSLERGRRVGQPGHEVAKRFLLGRMEAIGLRPFRGESLELPYELSTTFTNLVGVVPGRSSGLKPVLIGAHYDSVIDAPCSDDNATAVAVSLAAGELFMAEPLERDVIIALFDAEEPPFFLSEAMGSIRFYQDHCQGLDFAAVLIMDLIGHDIEVAGGGFGEAGEEVVDVADWLFVIGAESHASLPDALQRASARTPGLTVLPTLHRYVGDMSDHHAFRVGGQPFLFLSCGQGQYYHHPLDTPGWVNFEKVGRVFELLVNIAHAIDADGMPGADSADTTALEIQMFTDAFGGAQLPILDAFGLERLETRSHLDQLVAAIRARLSV